MISSSALGTSAVRSRARGSIWLLIGLVALGLGVGWLGSLVTTEQIPVWYDRLNKPAWTPPNWIFAPVWSTLYVLIGIAGWRIAPARAAANGAWGVWWVQLALNAIWTPLFFGAHAVLAALIVILLLVGTIVWFIRLTWGRDPMAAWLFVPYLAWVSYATTLNWGIWQLN